MPVKPKKQQKAPVKEGRPLFKLQGLRGGATAITNDAGSLAKNLGDQANENKAKLVTGTVAAYVRFKGKIDSTVAEMETIFVKCEDTDGGARVADEGGQREGKGLKALAVGKETTSNPTVTNILLRGKQMGEQLKVVSVGAAMAKGISSLKGDSSMESNTVAKETFDDDNTDSARPAAASTGSSLQLLPRTGSLVGGKTWNVVSAVYDMAAAVAEDVVGDII